MTISLIIPAHNEEHRLLRTLQQYSQAFQARYRNQFELIVVANGCTDNTAAIARKAMLTTPQIKLIDIQAPIGKGGAILEGFRHAHGTCVAFADADGATTPQALIELIDQLETYDVIIGSRRLSSSRILQKQSLKRRIFSLLFAASVWLLFGLPYRDTQCGAKAFRRKAAKHLAHMVEEHYWAFDVDLLLCAQALDFSIAERPVIWRDQAGSKLRVGSTILQVSQALWRMKRRHIHAKADIFATPLSEV